MSTFEEALLEGQRYMDAKDSWYTCKCGDEIEIFGNIEVTSCRLCHRIGCWIKTEGED